MSPTWRGWSANATWSPSAQRETPAQPVETTRGWASSAGGEEDSEAVIVKEEVRQGLDNEYHIKKRKLRGGTSEEQTL